MRRTWQNCEGSELHLAFDEALSCLRGGKTSEDLPGDFLENLMFPSGAKIRAILRTIDNKEFIVIGNIAAFGIPMLLHDSGLNLVTIEQPLFVKVDWHEKYLEFRRDCKIGLDNKGRWKMSYKGYVENLTYYSTWRILNDYSGLKLCDFGVEIQRVR